MRKSAALGGARSDSATSFQSKFFGNERVRALSILRPLHGDPTGGRLRRRCFRAVRQHGVIYRLVRPLQVVAREVDHTFTVPVGLRPAAGVRAAALLRHLMSGEPLCNVTAPQEIPQ